MTKDSKKIEEAVTDNYGDFRFDNLEENSGMYGIEIVYKDYEKKTFEIDLRTSTSLGTLLMKWGTYIKI